MKAPVIYVVIRHFGCDVTAAVGWSFDEREAEDAANAIEAPGCDDWGTVQSVDPIGEKSEIGDWKR